MKKTITLIVLLTLLVACSQTQTKSPTAAVALQEKNIDKQITQQSENKENEQKYITLQPIEEKETLPLVEVPPTPIQKNIIIEKSTLLSPELKELLQKADNELKSISYVYAESPGNIGFETYSVKGTKIKMMLFEKNDYVIDDYFNAVYLDTTAKTAKGKCENPKRCLSKTIDNTKRVYNLKYDDYRKKTPYEWIKEIDSAEIIGFETINNHAVTRIKTEKNGSVIEMWVDNRFGVPHRIKIITDENDKTYYFKNIMFNSVKDSGVNLPT